MILSQPTDDASLNNPRYSDRENRIRQLIKWVCSLKGGYIHPSLKLQSKQRQHHVPNGESPHEAEDFTMVIDDPFLENSNGVGAIDPGEMLMNVPLEATMSYLTFSPSSEAEESDGRYGYESGEIQWRKAIGRLLDTRKSDLHPRVFTAFFLLREYLDPGSKWKTYIQSLPQPQIKATPGKAISGLTTAACYDGEDLEWLRGTPASTGRELQLEMWTQEWNRTCEMMDSDKWRDDTEKWELYKWAVSILSSRSFTSSILPKDTIGLGRERDMLALDDAFPVLIPMIDMLDHQPLNKVEWRPGENGIGFAVMERLKPGQEVFNNYGPISNSQLLMGYGFAIPNNPCDYYPVDLKIPPDSPLAAAKTMQKQLRTEDSQTVQEINNIASKTDEKSYILNFDHPLRRKSYLEQSIFSQDLLDNLSILSANDKELEHLTVSLDRCWINRDQDSHDDSTSPRGRNLLNTFCQLLAEIQARLRLLKGSAKPQDPANVKQRNAQVYRHGQMVILETAVAILTHCLRRSLHRTRFISATNDEETVTDNLVGRVSAREDSRMMIRKAMLFGNKLTDRDELFSPDDTSQLLPQRLANGFRSFDQNQTSHRSALGSHSLFICCIYYLLSQNDLNRRVDIGAQNPSNVQANVMESADDDNAHIYRLKRWMLSLIIKYPIEAFEPDEDTGPELSEIFPPGLNDNTNTIPRHPESQQAMEMFHSSSWTVERLQWCMMLAMEEGVNVPPSVFEVAGEKKPDGHVYCLYIPQ